MSNLDDVIKDILGHMYYDRTKTISEQTYNNSKLLFEIDQVDNPQFSDNEIDRQATDRENKKTRQTNSFFATTTQKGTTATSNAVPITLRGIQPNLDLIVSSANINRIKIEEYQNINAPFDKPKAEKMFGEWCKALSTGNMVGKSGEDFWFDTTSPQLAQCSAAAEYYPKTLADQPETIDTKFGLKNLIPIYIDYKFDFNTSEKENQTSFQDALKPKKTKKQIEQEEAEKVEQTKKTFKLNANQSLANTLKQNPKWEPQKGWGLYKKGWDCLAGDCSQVGQIVSLPISKTTGKPVYKVYVGANNQQNVCKPIEYDYCLEISWSMLNGNSQPNGMKKFTLPSRNTQRQGVGSTFIACSTKNKLAKTFEKNPTLLYPWQIRYDGYCGTSDGETCTPISTEGKDGKVTTIENTCETSYEGIDVISSLDIRYQTDLTIPGNEIKLGVGNYQDQITTKLGTVGCPQCGDPYKVGKNCGYYDSKCRETAQAKCLQDCVASGKSEELKDEGIVFKSGQVIIGKR
jgi:hypothetical protein